MAINPDRAIDELYAPVRFCTARYGGNTVFQRMNKLLSRILTGGTTAYFQIFFDRAFSKPVTEFDELVEFDGAASLRPSVLPQCKSETGYYLFSRK